MATLTYTTTAEEDSAIVWAVERANAGKPVEKQKTPAQYFTGLVASALASYAAQKAAAEAEQVAVAYKAADSATQSSVKTTLGVS